MAGKSAFQYDGDHQVETKTSLAASLRVSSAGRSALLKGKYVHPAPRSSLIHCAARSGQRAQGSKSKPMIVLLAAVQSVGLDQSLD